MLTHLENKLLKAVSPAFSEVRQLSKRNGGFQGVEQDVDFPKLLSCVADFYLDNGGSKRVLIGMLHNIIRQKI